MLYYLEDRENHQIFLLFLYTKSDRETVTIQEIKNLMDADIN